MSKTPLSLHLSDLSDFTRALARELKTDRHSHLTLMNMIARAAGYQNVQHLRASTAATRRLKKDEDAPSKDARLVERTLTQFDAEGRLRQWPAKRGVQTLALWALWSVMPAQRSVSEKEVNACLNNEHLFQDPATLRRTMISNEMLARENDGSAYNRLSNAPPQDALVVIQTIAKRRKLRASNSGAPKATALGT